MTRKRTLELEESEEPPIVKKRKSRSKHTEDLNLETDVGKPNEEFEVSLENKMHPRVRNSKKKGKQVQMPKEEIVSVKPSLKPRPSSSTDNASKKKRKSKGDINQNGDIGQDTEHLKNSEKPAKTNKVKKKNGLQNRESCESPSDFQPLGQLLRKQEPLKNTRNKNVNRKDLKAKPKEIDIEKEVPKPLKGRKRKSVLLEPKTIRNDNSEQASVQKLDIKEDFPVSLISTHGEKNPRKKKYRQLEEMIEESSTHYIPKKIPKKKVRIEETESLKVKKELADSELHFSTRELPAKIIKSKLNKNLTEEVKVSPLTVQTSRKEKKIHKSVNMDNLAIKHIGPEKSEIKIEAIKLKDSIKDDDCDNEINLEDEDENSEDSDLEVYYINKNAEKEAKMKDKLSSKKGSILMPKDDQLILVQRIQNVIPEGDTKSYKFRLQKLEWEQVAFKNYSIEDCQKVWIQLLKKVRHYRLLTELTHDIKYIIEINDLQVSKPRLSKSSSKKHPDMPKRPLTSYFLYYIRKRDQIAKDRPDLDTLELNKFISEKYQNLPLDKKQKYENLAAKNREEYKRQVEEFYGKHPEMRKVITKKPKVTKQKPPKRPDNPYRLFMQSELSREEIAEEDKAEFKEVCREKWRQMSDTKKLGWINLAEEQLQKYEEELKEYMAIHPEYTVKAHPKSFLSREELKLKDKLAGKPKKPPGSAYGLFISLSMQGNDIVNVPPKERWAYTSTKWKAMTEEERDQYKQLVTQVQDQYEKDFKTYLDSLPEDKRQEEILLNMPKKRKNAAAEKPSTSGTTNTKSSTIKTQQPRRKSSATTKPKPQNPIPPPRSAFKYFAEKYGGENPKEAWKNLDPVEKENYEKELITLKDRYIKEFEVFLKGLSKEELAAFCDNRNAQSEYSSTDDSESESEHVDIEDSSDDSAVSSESDEN